MKAEPITWLDVFVAVSPLLGAIIAVSGVIATIAYTNRRERDRQSHERLAAREARLRDERIAAYLNLLAATTTAHVPNEGAAALSEAYMKISLLAGPDELDEAAEKVWEKYEKAQEIDEKTRKDPPEAVWGDFIQALDEAKHAREQFLKLARKELQVEPPQNAAST